MDQDKKNLKITSYIVIVLAIVNVIFLGIGFANGELKKGIEARVDETMIQSGASADEIEQSHDLVFNLSLNGTIIGVGIAVLLKLYLGIKGLHQAGGKIKGKGNIVWAKIIFVFTAISVFSSIISLNKGEIQLSSLISSLADLVIIFYYMKYANKVVEEEKV